ncbi:hypothetical protein HMPREF9141_0936 [Prevotella multiformis DSM 16608]|uniref:Uncharacterized protein n=1 Tax=Prevotella multiformis DSM 16608 TaxID=888743 RepID=F0F5S0_9BACT|nr:hypothetical protein HMPREF9141_0936 [Prevotella multiformis DSM 16608]
MPERQRAFPGNNIDRQGYMKDVSLLFLSRPLGILFPTAGNPVPDRLGTAVPGLGNRRTAVLASAGSYTRCMSTARSSGLNFSMA